MTPGPIVILLHTMRCSQRWGCSWLMRQLRMLQSTAQRALSLRSRGARVWTQRQVGLEREPASTDSLLPSLGVHCRGLQYCRIVQRTGFQDVKMKVRLPHNSLGVLCAREDHAGVSTLRFPAGNCTGALVRVQRDCAAAEGVLHRCRSTADGPHNNFDILLYASTSTYQA